MGQREGMTKLDARKLKMLYGCERSAVVTEIIGPDCKDRMAEQFCISWKREVSSGNLSEK